MQTRSICRSRMVAVLTTLAIMMLAEGMAARLHAADKSAEGPRLIRSAKSGPWSAPATWEGGKIPAATSRVQVRAGHTVTYDLKSDVVIRSVHVAGNREKRPHRMTASAGR